MVKDSSMTKPFTIKRRLLIMVSRVKSVRSVRRVESIVNPGYPFLYLFRKGGQNGQKRETYYA